MKFTGFTRHAGLTLGLLVLAANALASPASYRLRVDGLACPFCAYGIEKQLSKLDGVARVETDIGDASSS
ncbi:MAG: heavy-metal-associated domain-containing protein [Pseudomonadota bacterium]|nr:heavy-metal-associated domain-containing protein [Pseudomonadota bacterium]